MRWRRLLAAVAVPAMLLLPTKLLAAEIRVVSAANMREILSALGEVFERATGHRLAIAYSKAGAVADRVRKGEPGDIVVLQSEPMADLVQENRVVSGSVIELAHTVIVLIVRAGAPRPDIGSPEALRQALLASDAFAYTDPALGGTSGVYFGEVLDRLGLVDATRAKARLVPHAPDVWNLVAAGGASLGANQVSDLTPLPPGIALVGTLPPPFAAGAVMSAGMVTDTREAEGATALLRFLTSKDAARAIRAHGMEP